MRDNLPGIVMDIELGSMESDSSLEFRTIEILKCIKMLNFSNTVLSSKFLLNQRNKNCCHRQSRVPNTAKLGQNVLPEKPVLW